MKYFLYSAVTIYYVEQPAVFGALAVARLNAITTVGDSVVISDLVRMECLVKPLKTRNLPLLAAYQAFFRASFVEVVPVTSAICDVAAQIRADENFKPLDALHLAAALDSGCRALLTNDRRLARFSRLTVEAVT